MHEFLESEAALKEFMHLFETGILSRERWTHAAHIAAGTVLLRRDGAGVLTHMRAAIQRHNANVGTPPSAYHQTLTVFWLAVLDGALPGHMFGTDFDAVVHTVGRFGEQRKLHTEYYSFDVVRSSEARARWVAPDARSLCVTFRTN